MNLVILALPNLCPYGWPLCSVLTSAWVSIVQCPEWSRVSSDVRLSRRWGLRRCQLSSRGNVGTGWGSGLGSVWCEQPRRQVVTRALHVTWSALWHCTSHDKVSSTRKWTLAEKPMQTTRHKSSTLEHWQELRTDKQSRVSSKVEGQCVKFSSERS